MFDLKTPAAADKPSLYADLLAAADASAQWYENFSAHMRLSPLDFAYSYITRSGRVDLNRLKQTSPEFAGLYEARISTGKAHP
jgi:hypothetical protein